MRGPPPKSASTRQRRNRATTASLLPSIEDSRRRTVPTLPKRESPAEKWHPKVVGWWKAFWRSPMAEEVQESDKLGGLYLAAESLQRAWTARDDASYFRSMESFHRMMVEFGGSPIARRRLQWEIEKGDQAEERTSKRRERREKEKKLKETAKRDPRDVLKVVG